MAGRSRPLVAVLVLALVVCLLGGGVALAVPDPVSSPPDPAPAAGTPSPAASTPAVPSPASAPATPNPAAKAKAAKEKAEEEAFCDMLPEPGRTTCKAGHNPVKTYHEVRDHGGSVPDALGAGLAESFKAPAQGALDRFSPTTAIGDVAKTCALTGLALLKTIGQLVQDTTGYDPLAGWFTRQYAIAFGLALILMVFVLLATMARASRAGADREEAFQAAFAYFPLAFVMASIGPAVASVLTDAMDATSTVLADSAGLDAQAFLAHASQIFGDTTPDQLLGGVGMLLILGVWSALAGVALWFEMIAREFGLYLTSFFMPFALAFWINPRSRRHTARALGVWLTLLFIKPITFATFGLMWAAANGFGALPGTDEQFSTLMFAVAAATLTAATPVIAYKYAPSVAAHWAPAAAGVQAPGGIVSVSEASRAKLRTKMARLATPLSGTGSAGRTPGRGAPAGRGPAHAQRTRPPTRRPDPAATAGPGTTRPRPIRLHSEEGETR